MVRKLSQDNSIRQDGGPHQQRSKKCGVNLEQPSSQVKIAREEPRQAGHQDRRQSHEVGLGHLRAKKDGHDSQAA